MNPHHLNQGDDNEDDLIAYGEHESGDIQIVYDSDLFEDTLLTEEGLGISVCTNTVESEELDDENGVLKYTFTVNNFSRFNTEILYSSHFLFGDYKWRLLVFPKGNCVDQLSLYLEVADSASLPEGWNTYAHFCITVVNQIQPKESVKKDTEHCFHARESGWGFTSFMPHSELYDSSKGFLLGDTCIIEAYVSLHQIFVSREYHSREETGYVGLKNLGATCYMNSLLQILYHIPYFRKAVYHIPTTENEIPSGSIPLALQTLFYKLQYNDATVATKELTKSFGWDTCNSVLQHDVQEFNSVLSEKLEAKMKGTAVEGTIHTLFEGHCMKYIECINVDFRKTTKDSFRDIQLDVKGCQDVYASFDKYVEVEHFDGHNKYYDENYGFQDAKMGVLISDFPPILQLQLKRFDYDFMRDTMVKIHDHYEFPLELDLDRENGKYLSLDADKSVRNLYTLHSVLVHSGELHGGHYYAYIRPTLSEQWFEFDDEWVRKVDSKRVLEDQYGGEEEFAQTPGLDHAPSKFTKVSNAYVLVYIRESDKDKIICDVDEKEFAEHLRIRLKKEQEYKEYKRRCKAEALLYTVIKVARDDDLLQQIGKNIHFDLVDHKKVCNFRILKQISFVQFKEEVAIKFCIQVQFQRYWIWGKRQNQTYRPTRPLTPHEESQTVGKLEEFFNKINAELNLFLEIIPELEQCLIPPSNEAREDILLFFKLYDPKKEDLRYVGSLFVSCIGKPAGILRKLNEMAGFDPDEEIELYEEVKFEPCVMCEYLDKRASFRSSQMKNGDIICFQKYPQPQNMEEYRYPDVPSYLEYVKNHQIVRFRSLSRPEDEDFCLELSKLHTYDDVVGSLSLKLGLEDPSKIRLTSHNCYTQRPKPYHIEYRAAEHLLDMLVHYKETSDILYYEVLDIPLANLQDPKTLKVAFHHASKDEVVIPNIQLPKQSTVQDVLNEIRARVELSHSNAELRLLEVFHNKIYKIFPLNEKIDKINDQWTLRAEEIPEEEKNLGPVDRLINVHHFTKETAHEQMRIKTFEEPFLLITHDDETLAEIKIRIQKKLQVSDEEFTKRRNVYGSWDQYLGLEHSDTAKSAFTANQDRQAYEKPLKIYN